MRFWQNRCSKVSRKSIVVQTSHDRVQCIPLATGFLIYTQQGIYIQGYLSFMQGVIPWSAHALFLRCSSHVPGPLCDPLSWILQIFIVLAPRVRTVNSIPPLSILHIRSQICSNGQCYASTRPMTDSQTAFTQRSVFDIFPQIRKRLHLHVSDFFQGRFLRSQVFKMRTAQLLQRNFRQAFFGKTRSSLFVCSQIQNKHMEHKLLHHISY